MFNRVHEIGLRVGSLDDRSGRPVAAALAALRVGVNIIRLRNVRQALGPAGRRVADLALDRIVRQLERGAGAQELTRLIAALDRSIARIGRDPSPTATQALLAIAGIRHALASHPALAMPQPAAAVDGEAAA